MIRNNVLVYSKTIEEKALAGCHSIIAAFFPDKKILNVPADNIQDIPGDYQISLDYSRCSDRLWFTFRLKSNQEEYSASGPAEQFPKIPGTNGTTLLFLKESAFQLQLKRTLYLFLAGYTGDTVPWGILTGIRPGKLLTKMERLGFSTAGRAQVLRDIYYVADEKISLLQEVAEMQKPAQLDYKAERGLICLYVSVPFCPSLCYYCTFPSVIPNRREISAQLETYVSVLTEEIKLAGQLMKEEGFLVDTVYIGGGTPTVLDLKELDNLCRTIRENIPLVQQPEYTVEAGRPDTVDRVKLKLLKSHGVNRLSINPQTMQDATLKRIGRNHSAADIIRSYELAREIGSWIINMDLIIGLPGEGFPEIEESLAKVLALAPENLTIHALALKKGSTAFNDNHFHGSPKGWRDIQAYADRTIRSSGYLPYYLYRQKHTAGNLENIGYSLAGYECRYNMAIIEELQTVIGVGACSSTKIVNPADHSHKNIYNPADIKTYVNRFRSIHEQKLSEIQKIVASGKKNE